MKNYYIIIFILLINTSCNEEIIIPDAPYGLQIQYFCKSDFPEIKDIDAQGMNIKWYSSETEDIELDSLFDLVDGSSYFATQTINGVESKARFRVTVSVTELQPPTGETSYSVINIGHINTAFSELSIAGDKMFWLENDNVTSFDPETNISSSGEYFIGSMEGNCRSLNLTKLSVEVNKDLLLFYDMNDNTNDLSLNQYHGAFNGTFSSGRVDTGLAATFNGTDQYIELPNEQSLERDFPMSFSYWIKFDEISYQNGAVFTNDYVENNHTGAWMVLSSLGELSVNIGNGNGISSNTRKTLTVNTALEPNVWYHVAAVLTNINDFKIYVNGQLQSGQYVGTATNIEYSQNPGSIGRKDGSTLADPYYFKGQLDDFTYWGRVISQEEIVKLMGG